MTLHRIVLSVLAAATISADAALAQGTFPAPLPGQAASPTDGSAPKAIIGVPTPFSSAEIASSVPSACMKDFARLREDAEKKGKLITEARDRHAPPDEACKLVGAYSTAEVKMMKYVEANAARCGIAGSVMEQLKAGHKNTDVLLQKVCSIAEQVKTRGSGQINDFGDPAWKRAPRGPVGDFPEVR